MAASTCRSATAGGTSCTTARTAGRSRRPTTRRSSPTAATSSRRRPSTTCSSTRSCRCSTTGRTACPGAGAPLYSTTWSPAGRPSWPAGWCVTTPRATTCPRPRPRAAWPATTSPPPGSWPTGSARPPRPGRGGAGARITGRGLGEPGAPGPDEVEVQVAYGRVDDADELPEVELATLKQHGRRTADGWAFEGEVPLATPGAFGYTVRVVPRHVGLAAPSELGLVAWARGGGGRGGGGRPPLRVGRP